jgi:hypothetical protein
MTVAAEGDTPKGTLYSIQDTKDRGRAVYASDRIPTGTTVHVASKPYVSVIKEQFKKEVCAWCFKYHHGKTCPIKHSDGRTGVWFCSTDCLQNWTDGDYDGRLAEALTSLRTNAARKVSQLQICTNSNSRLLCPTRFRSTNPNLSLQPSPSGVKRRQRPPICHPGTKFWIYNPQFMTTKSILQRRSPRSSLS